MVLAFGAWVMAASVGSILGSRWATQMVIPVASSLVLFAIALISFERMVGNASLAPGQGMGSMVRVPLAFGGDLPRTAGEVIPSSFPELDLDSLRTASSEPLSNFEPMVERYLGSTTK